MSVNFKASILSLDEKLKNHIAAGGKFADASADYQQQVIALVNAASNGSAWQEAVEDIAHLLFTGGVMDIVLPQAVDAANQSANVANSAEESLVIQGTAIAEHGKKQSKLQSQRAKNPRKKVELIGGDTVSFGDLLKKHVNMPEHLETSAKDLWSSFQGELDNNGLHPEIVKPRIGDHEILTYDGTKGRESIQSNTFSTKVSLLRNKKSR